MRTSMLALCSILLALSTVNGAEGGDDALVPSAVPIDPVDAIISAFRSHPIVALGEGTHDNEQGHQFRLALIRDPRFSRAVNDIVVEWGNSRYQDTIDRFVNGDDVPYDSLRRVWQDTTQPDALWDAPIYEEFFRTVRSVNASLPRRLRMRVLLGDPPIDWSVVHNAQEYGRWDRDSSPVDIIQREVLQKGRRALVIYGDLHLVHRNPRDVSAPAHSIVSLLESETAAKVFSIRTIAWGIDLASLQPDVRSWPYPVLAMLKGTKLGTSSFSSYYPHPLVVGAQGKPLEHQEERQPVRMEELFDAILYLGPQSTITRSQLVPLLCSDAVYMNMRLGRMSMLGMKDGVDRLKKGCSLAK